MTEMLRLDEAVPLGYALLAEVATQAGFRMLAIKGPVLAAQGLREPKVSVDVDVLVAPDDASRLRAALMRCGWQALGVVDSPGLVPHHSVTFRHGDWPCEIDVHHWFPGFLADPAVVFDVVWSRRITLDLAGRALAAPDMVASAAVAALHLLRDGDTAHVQARLEDLASRVVDLFGRESIAELSALAAATGAAETLRPFLIAVGAPAVDSTASIVVPLADWELRTHARTREVLRWLVGIERVRWRARPAYVWRAVWGEEHVRHQFGGAEPGRGALNRARRERIARGLRALPPAWVERRRLRRKLGR